jgi:hypothetical protein
MQVKIKLILQQNPIIAGRETIVQWNVTKGEPPERWDIRLVHQNADSKVRLPLASILEKSAIGAKNITIQQSG